MSNIQTLEDLAKDYKEFDPSSPEFDFDYWHVLFDFEKISMNLAGNYICELGCSTGAMSLRLINISERLTIIDGSRANLTIVKSKMISEYGQKVLEKVSFNHSLWENFVPDISQKNTSDVLITHGLEHVEDPVGLLKNINGWMPSNSRLHIIVPNANSLHRQIGVAMGLLKVTTDLNNRDLKVGHKRVYTRSTLMNHLKQSGFKILHWEGIYLKPLSNNQMKIWDEKLIRAFLEVGKQLPEYCSEIYMIAEPN